MLEIERWQEKFRSEQLFKIHKKHWTKEKETGEILPRTRVNSLCTVVVSYHVLHRGSIRLASTRCTNPQGRCAVISMHAVTPASLR